MYDLLSTNRLLEYGKVNQYPVIAQLVERETVVVLIAGISRSLVRIRFAGFFLYIVVITIIYTTTHTKHVIHFIRKILVGTNVWQDTGLSRGNLSF